MTVTAEQTIMLSARVSENIKSELDELAKSTGRKRNALVQEALRRFIEVERWQIADIEQALQEADAGAFATDAEMEALWAGYHAK